MLQRAPDWSIDTIPAFCITLERRPDRWRRFQDQPFMNTMNVQRFFGVDGKTLDLKNDPRVGTLTKRNILINERRSHEELDSIGGVGCALSHIALWQWMVDNNQQFALIFEDDAVVPDDFVRQANAIIHDSTVLKQPGGWELWLLGAITDDISSIPQEPRRSGVIRVEAFALTHAYVITLAAAKQFLKDVYPIHAHIDLWMSVEAYLIGMRIVTSTRMKIRQYERAKTDIQNENGCKICDVPADFYQTQVMVSKWEWGIARAAEATLVGIALYWLYHQMRATSTPST